MDIILPKKKKSDQPLSVDSQIIVVVGANGSGKTRFGSDLEKRYNRQTHRISAQKSLSMPKDVRPTSKSQAQSEFLYGHFDNNGNADNLIYKKGSRWGDNPETFLLNDYEKLMVLLHTEEYEMAIGFKDAYLPSQNTPKPISNLDKVKEIWEYVLPHRKLIKRAGCIETFGVENADKPYNAAEMSDGERVIFYLVGEVVSAPENSIVIIDEPEMHIHKSITKKLWDKIENERLDCTFIYLTHDLDFAFSRHGALKIWAKGYDGSTWDYDIINDHTQLPEQLFLEILGSRKPILFIEGDESSIDYRLMSMVFTDYTIKPLGNCKKVFDTAISFKDQLSFHHIDSFGLIDRDRRTDEEVTFINHSNIWVANVAEIENFLIIEDVVRTVALEMGKNPDEVFPIVKSNVKNFFNTQIEKQALEHTISQVDRFFRNSTNSANVKTIVEFEHDMEAFWGQQNFRKMYDDILASFQIFANTEDYPNILKVFNNKGLLHNSGVANLCDLNPQNDAYLNYILKILKQQSNNSISIRNVIIENIKK